jgi:hypothetical protein
MKIYLFINDGRPDYRCSVAEVQAVLEDQFRERRDVTDVWWDDEDPLRARLYMYGSSHSDYGLDPDDPYKNLDFETTDQLIWPMSLSEEECKPIRRCPLGGAELTMTIRTDRMKSQLVRSIPEDVWNEERLREHVIMSFAVNAGQSLADHWKSKERT